MPALRIATIGTSAIAQRLVEAVGEVADVEYVAAFSRELSRAEGFGRPRGARLFFDDLEALAASDEVDAVYVASPNGLHVPQALVLASAGKHVLVEKSLAPNQRRAKELFDAAHTNGAVCLEAMRNLHTQGFDNIEGALGRLGRVTQASLRFGKVTSRIGRLRAGEHVNQFDPALGEGALVDIGVYCVEPAVALFGRPEAVRASLVTIDVPWGSESPYQRVDLAGSIALEYADKVIELSYSKVGDDLLGSQVMGDEATLLWDETSCPRDLRLVHHEDVGMAYSTVGGSEELVRADVPQNDMVCELELFAAAARGEEAALARVARFERVTLDSLAVMDEARRQAGVRFPDDE
ncbi:Gfo/Idh/MocA family protein [Olsenella phocaeensis]|uniref:Gfo/Idh/MocA family protein n=1 Tax=Olsenella phocaeensis TaxID=1852385 RepID=UPI000931E7F2|nr:Gfo/Idh/MocA family oxidoreductase [Olsenella phocaeensis]